uniref:HECT-type E3 ubiquitin transferase n=1 Tax=Euplotes harpa TaxID=151035 RepID=A0A7S3J8L2_9SPIT|mmetsp:Transcript_23389/g.26803  ORF Transcript_23389/g.26803 Transcript_23389/m.26803 type:complete len:163 (+) Transcript_23389:169-657(+)
MMSSFVYLENNLFSQSEMSMNFTVSDKSRGIVELIKDGLTVMVNNYNKYVYIQLVLSYYGYHKANEQINSFLEGFYEVIPQAIVNILQLEDLENLLSGISKIDINDWKNNTNYTGENADANHPTIIAFWKVIESLSDLQLRKILQFCTGCRSVPIEGFKTLK